MSNEVYANGNEIACKSGDDKVIASFPDVCLSPPSPPAGPIPVPYPNTSFSKDTQNGSKTVKINGKEVMLKDQSFYKTTPLGDEAATKGLGASVITHVITGKTYFVAWSMDVKFEDENVDRHLDLTSSNHASYPGSPPPVGPALEASNLALDALKEDLCPCCLSDTCTAALPRPIAGTLPRTPYSSREWYQFDDIPGNPPGVGTARKAELASLPCLGAPCKNASKGPEERKSDPPCDVYRVLTSDESEENEAGLNNDRLAELRKKHGVPVEKLEAARAIHGPFATRAQAKAVPADEMKINHVTPRAAGGCPTSENNTEGHRNLCDNCKKADNLRDTWSGQELERRRKILGIK
jgi:Domain of unknown function (DUF4150)